MDNNNIDNNFHLILSQETYRGNYSNLAVISHSSSEFVIDFARVSPGLKQPEVCDRVVLAPEHAKQLAFVVALAVGVLSAQMCSHICQCYPAKQKAIALHVPAQGLHGRILQAA